MKTSINGLRSERARIILQTEKKNKDNLINWREKEKKNNPIFWKAKNPKHWKSKTFLITSNESLQQFPLFRGNARIFMSWKTNKGENLLRNKTKQIKQIVQVQKLLKLSFCGGYIQNESTPGQKTLSTLFRRRWIREAVIYVLAEFVR